MSVPSQQQLHRPILEIARDSQGDVSIQQIVDALAQRFSLNAEDLAEVIPSGKNRFYDRISWAVFYLKDSGLLEPSTRAHYHITEQGQQILAIHRGDIREALLKRRKISKENQVSPEFQDAVVDASSGVTPDEQMWLIYRALEDKLAGELLDSVRRIPPDRFESLVVKLLEKMGYGKGDTVGRSGDGGIDGVIDQDQLGLEKVYVQAKRWQNPVGEPEIRNFSGSLSAQGASKGVFITTSSFGPKAQETARNISAGNQFIRLIDGVELARLMVRYDVGVFTETTYHIKKLDENYLSEEL